MKIPPIRGGRSKIPWKLVIDSFKGLASLLDDIILGKMFAKEALNLILVQDGRWKTRWGTAYYGSALPAGETKFLGCGIYEKADGTQEKIAIAGSGKGYKSVGDGAWTEITGATFTTTAEKFDFEQSVSQLYISNGVDRLTRYNGSVFLRYTPLPAPTGLAGVRSVLTAGAYPNYYKVTALNAVGETVGSAEINIPTNKARNAWLPASNERIDLSWSAVSGATRYQIYYSDESGKELLLANTSTTDVTFKDDGTNVQNPFFTCPVDDTTGAPAFKMIADSGSRLWGITDELVFWSGTGNELGIFSEFYGGGSQPLIDGTGEKLEWIGHFRSGKGDSVATVLTRNKAGIGAIWQVPLEATTIADTTIIIPNPQKLPGPIGTVAMLGVIDANDSLYIPNARGIFSLNNKANVTNILSTGELSGNIRPSFRDLQNIEDIAGIWYDSKLIWTGSQSGNGNDIMFGLDSEQNEWFWKWTIGFKSFLEITEANGTTKLLGIPNTGGQLIEISKNIKGDLGQPFYQSWISGLIPISDDSATFANVQEALVELGRPTGTIYFEILGLGEKKGFSSVGTREITDSVSNIDFTNGLFGEYMWGEDDDLPETYSQASVPKAKRIGKKLRAIQFHIYSYTADTDFTILKVQAKGFIEKMRTSSKFFK